MLWRRMSFVSITPATRGGISVCDAAGAHSTPTPSERASDILVPCNSPRSPSGAVAYHIFIVDRISTSRLYWLHVLVSLCCWAVSFFVIKGYVDFCNFQGRGWNPGRAHIFDPQTVFDCLSACWWQLKTSSTINKSYENTAQWWLNERKLGVSRT